MSKSSAMEEDLRVQMQSSKNRLKLIVNQLIDDIWSHPKKIQKEEEKPPAQKVSQKFYTSIFAKINKQTSVIKKKTSAKMQEGNEFLTPLKSNHSNEHDEKTNEKKMRTSRA